MACRHPQFQLLHHQRSDEADHQKSLGRPDQCKADRLKKECWSWFSTERGTGGVCPPVPKESSSLSAEAMSDVMPICEISHNALT